MKLNDFLTEASLPPTTYGYWIDPYGDVFPVDYQEHSRIIQQRAKIDVNFALVKGWVKITCHDNLLAVALSPCRLRPAVKNQLIKIARSQNFSYVIYENVDDQSARMFELVHEFVRFISEEYEREFGGLMMEAPLADLQFHGDMSQPGTFRKDDIKKMNNPVWKDRVMRIFSRSPYQINLHFLNGSRPGKVRYSYKGRNINYIDAIDVSTAAKYVGLHTKGWAQRIIGKEFENTEDKINVLLITNEGGARIGLTPWMVAHRIGHCFLEDNMRDENGVFITRARELRRIISGITNDLILSKVADSPMEAIRKLSPQIRSVRTDNLRDSGEYGVELFAYYLIHGKVEFDRSFIGEPPMEYERHSPLEAEIIDALRRTGNISALWRVEDEGYFADMVDGVFDVMKYSELRPRTRKALATEIKHIVQNDRVHIGPNNHRDATKGQKLHHLLEDAEEKIGVIFETMLKHSLGNFVVL